MKIGRKRLSWPDNLSWRMTQLSNGIFYGFLLIIPVLLGLGVLAFFIIALYSKGMQRMSFFTMVLAGVSVVFVLLNGIGLDFANLLPVRLIATPHLVMQWMQLLVLLMAYTGVFIAALRQKDIRIIILAWFVILLFNAGDMLFNAYHYFTWVKPAGKVYANTPMPVILEHVKHNSRERFLTGMIYPSFWILISTFSLAKTVKEKIRMYLATADKEQA